MKMSSVKEFLAFFFSSVSTSRSLEGMKNLEWAFIFVRWLAVPITLLMAWLHNPVSPIAMIGISMLLALSSIIATLLNQRIETQKSQQRLGVAMLIIDALLVWGILFLFADEFYTAAYAYFAIVIIEGAMRFGLMGSLIMSGVFALGLYGAMLFRLSVYDVRFSISGYAFWTSFMVLVALAVGLIVQEAQRERNRNVIIAKEVAIMTERNRIARDLHDTINKTLQGLVLETYALQTHINSPVAHEKVQYIRTICQRSSLEIRDMIHELRDGNEDRGIVSQLSMMIGSWSKTTGIGAELSVTGVDCNLPIVTSHNLKQVLSEALANIRKHAHASHVHISIQVLPDELRLEVQDNGCGFDPAGDNLDKFERSQKFGIMMMKERVNILGGQFSIENRNGARLIIRVPIDKPVDEG